MRTILYAGLLACALAPPACAPAPAGVQSDSGQQVTIDYSAFWPERLTIAKDTTVTWLNHEDIPHSVVLDGIGVRSKVLDTGDSFSAQFDKTGTFAYISGLHPHMHGQIVVQ